VVRLLCRPTGTLRGLGGYIWVTEGKFSRGARAPHRRTSTQLALRDPDIRLMLRVRDDDSAAFAELVGCITIDSSR